MTDERLLWHLENWAEWQRRGNHYGTGYASRASGGIGRSGNTDFEAMVATADARCALAVDTILDGLPPAERSSVHHYHLGAVFRFPHVGLGAEIAYERAKNTIRIRLLLRGIV